MFVSLTFSFIPQLHTLLFSVIISSDDWSVTLPPASLFQWAWTWFEPVSSFCQHFVIMLTYFLILSVSKIKFEKKKCSWDKSFIFFNSQSWKMSTLKLTPRPKSVKYLYLLQSPSLLFFCLLKILYRIIRFQPHATHCFSFWRHRSSGKPLHGFRGTHSMGQRGSFISSGS